MHLTPTIMHLVLQYSNKNATLLIDLLDMQDITEYTINGKLIIENGGIYASSNMR